MCYYSSCNGPDACKHLNAGNSPLIENPHVAAEVVEGIIEKVDPSLVNFAALLAEQLS